MTYLDHTLKSTAIFTDKGLYSQSYGFSSSQVWTWELNHQWNWMPKNWCFWIMVLEKTFESLLDSKELKLVNPKGNQPEYSLEGLMLKLKLQYFGLLMQRIDSLEKTLMFGKIEGGRIRGWQRMRRLDGIINLMDMSWARSRCWWWTRRPGLLQSIGLQRVGDNWATELNCII